MVLVTGGTGLVGSHLLLHLLERGVEVRAIHRAESDLQSVKKVFSYYIEKERVDEYFQKIEWVQSDIMDIPSLGAAFRGIEKVYHVAALISFDPNDYELLMRINAEGTANVVNLCISNGVTKLCYASSVATIGKSPEGGMADEEDEFTEQGANVYAHSKYLAEMEVWRGSQEGLSVVMVNPGIILGPGFWKGGSGTLFTTASKGYSYYPPGGTGFVTVRDVVGMMVGLMDSPITNERFISVSENMSYREILVLLSHHLGLKAPGRQLRFWQLEVFRVFDLLRHLIFGHRRRMTKNSIHSLRHRKFYNNEKIGRAIDFTFEPIGDAVQFSCERLMEESL